MLNQRSFLGFDNLWFCMTASFLFLFLFLKKNTLKWYKGKGATGLWFTLKWFWKRNTEWQRGMGGSEKKTENNTAKSKCDKTWQNLGNWGGVDGNFPLSLRVLQNWRESSELERHCWVALAAGTCYCLTLGGLEARITEVLREGGFSGVLRCLMWMESGMSVCVDTEKGRTLKFSNESRREREIQFQLQPMISLSFRYPLPTEVLGRVTKPVSWFMSRLGVGALSHLGQSADDLSGSPALTHPRQAVLGRHTQ